MKTRLPLLCMILCFLMLLLTGCRLTHYTRKEARRYLKEQFPGEDFQISFFYKTRPSQRGTGRGYRDRVWNVRMKDKTKLSFEVVSNEAYGRESVDHWLTTNYDHVYGKYYFEQYQKNESTSFFFDKEGSSAWLKTKYLNRTKLNEAISEAWNINEYIKSQNHFLEPTYEFKIISPLDQVYEENDTTYWTHEFTSKEELLEAVTCSYALYCAKYRLNINEFKDQELRDWIASDNRSDIVQIVREDGTYEIYDDLIFKSSGISFGTLYEVLSRNGFHTEGTPERFSVVGIHNDEYEFSYSYHNCYSGKSDKTGYYYKKNGEIIPMKDNMQCWIKKSLFEEISGMSYAFGH